jgi:tRNA-uridine 2-sulfurtransferase
MEDTKLNTLNPRKVVVGMSGGVDSSVVAGLLKEQGYEVIGLTITPFKVDSKCRVEDNARSCCSATGLIDATEVCKSLNIEHRLIDLSDKFKNEIVEDFISEYLAGKTPNPCVNCNPGIKWEGLIRKADELGAKYVATGHYANTRFDESTGRWVISAGLDKSKDQSYVLWKLTQVQIERTIFPLSDLNKIQTRQLAEKYHLKVYNKPESQEICFIPDDDYHRFLRENVPDIDEKIGRGDILLNGKVVGKHEGYPFYTVGQRKGLGVTFESRLFVKSINAESNTIEVAEKEGSSSNKLTAGSVNLIKYPSLDEPRKFLVKIRYNDKGEYANCRINDDGKLQVEFTESRFAITPGQSVVMYEGDDLVGGGIIEEGN